MQDVKETIYGNRMNLSANCIGGVKFDMDDSLTMYMLERLDTVEEAVKRVEKVFRTDPLIAKRSRGVGVLSREDAWALGVVGPVARGSGLDIDVRKNTPYLVYPDLYFDIVKEQDGDVWSRAMVRVREVFESIRLLRQCLDKLPDGPLAVHMERIPESESVARSEAPRGELIYYLQTNGTRHPRPPQVARAVLHELGGPHRHDEGLPARRHPRHRQQHRPLRQLHGAVGG